MDDFKSALEAAGFKVTKLSHRQAKKRKQQILRRLEDRLEYELGRPNANTKRSITGNKG